MFCAQDAGFFMRIAIWHNLPSGGGKRALHDQVRGLVEQGHVVEVWSPETADASFLPLAGLVQEHVLPLRWRAAGRTSARIDLVRWALLDRHLNLRALEAHCRAAAEEIGKGSFDLLLSHGSSLMAVPPIARHVNMPKVLYLQEPERAMYEAMPDWPWIPPRLRDVDPLRGRSILGYLGQRALLAYYGDLARLEEQNIRAFDRVLANSLYSRESILRAHAVDARVCYLGVDPHRFSPRNLARDGSAIGVGSFHPHKCIDFVIRALGRVRGKRPPLVWVGNAAAPGYVEDLRQLAAEVGVAFDPRTNVSDEVLVDLLNRASMMVYAPRLEPFGYGPLEANACALPVVGVAEGGVRETLVDGENGLLVERELEAVARAVERLRDDPALASCLGSRGRRVVESRWSIEAARDRLGVHLRSVVGREPT